MIQAAKTQTKLGENDSVRYTLSGDAPSTFNYGFSSFVVTGHLPNGEKKTVAGSIRTDNGDYFVR